MYIYICVNFIKVHPDFSLRMVIKSEIVQTASDRDSVRKQIANPRNNVPRRITDPPTTVHTCLSRFVSVSRS